MQELVSIIVPIYNVEAYLIECVESLLGQTHPEIEIILVDDGSTDSSREMAEQFAVRDARVVAFRQPNAGPGAARNAGLDRARGTFVSFVDSDDWVHPQYVERLLELQKCSSADIVVCGLERFSSAAAPFQSAADGGLEVFDSATALKALMGAKHTIWTVACAKLYRASVLSCLRFPPGRLHEDEFFTYQAIARASRISYSEAPLYFYRQRPGSIMASGLDWRRGRDAIDAYRERARFFEKQGMRDLADEAHAQLFRRYVSLYRALSSEDARRSDVLRPEMRRLASGLLPRGVPPTFKLFACAYAWLPNVTDVFYSRRIH